MTKECPQTSVLQEAPKRIWAWWFMPEEQNDDMQGGWTFKYDAREQEYIRADEVQRLIADAVGRATRVKPLVKSQGDEWSQT